MITDKALKKARILAFWEKHGLKATIDAFDVKKEHSTAGNKNFKKEMEN